MTEKKIEKRKSNRSRYADKVSKQVPYNIGRDTRKLSNSELRRIGLTHGVAK